MKITKKKKIQHSELDKRTYLPYIISSICKKCGTKTKIDLDERYLSYPKLNEPEEIYFVCSSDKCEEEWEEYIILNFQIKECK